MNASFDSNKLLSSYLAQAYVPAYAANSESKTAQAPINTLPTDVIKHLILNYLKQEERIPCPRPNLSKLADLQD